MNGQYGEPMQKIVIIITLSLLSPPSALALEGLMQEAAQRWNVPQKLIHAIASHESGLNPWAVNVQGKGYMPQSREEALAIANRAWERGQSFDIGLMQINSYWLRRFGFTPAHAIEPKNNVLIGTWILSKELKKYGLTWQAIASYHTPIDKNPERGKRYALAIIGQLKKQRAGK